MSGIAMQALTIVIGIVAFGTKVTTLLTLGVTATIVTSSIYAYLKTSNVLEQRSATEKATEMQTEIETRVHLRSADSAAHAP